MSRAHRTIRPFPLLSFVASLALACGTNPDDTTPDGGDGADGGGGDSADGGGGSDAGGGGDGGNADCDADPRGADDLPDVVEYVSGVTVTTLAGSDTPGDLDGSGPHARFNNPVNVILREDGELAVADFDNGAIRNSTLGGEVTTLVTGAGIGRPFGLALGSQGALFVGTDYDMDGHDAGPAGGVIWQVDPGTGTHVALAAEAGRPRGLAAWGAGLVAVSDLTGARVSLLDPDSGDLEPLVGKAGCAAFADGDADSARFNRPYGVVVTPDGDLLVADQANHRIRRITPAGDVTTFAGDGTPDMVDGPLATARFNAPQALAIDAAGNIFVSDVGNHRIRRIGTDGEVATVAGDGTAGFRDGAGDESRFFGQEGIAVSPDGRALYVADGTNGEIEPYHRLRKISLP